MFKRVEIQLSGPLCKCATMNLGWGVVKDDGGKGLGLRIFCKTCKVEIRVPADQFIASFKLDVPYPGEKTEEKSKNKLGVIDGGKVIPLHKDESEE